METPNTPDNVVTIALNAIHALSLLFYNYTDSDLAALRKDKQFDQLWREIVQADDTYPALWAKFFDMPVPTQRMVIGYALTKYGEEASRRVR